VPVHGLTISDAEIQMYFFEIKYTEAILSNSSRKPLWFEITKMLIAVLAKKCVIYYTFRHTCVPYMSLIESLMT